MSTTRDVAQIVLDKAIDPLKRIAQNYLLQPEIREHDKAVFYRSNGLLSWDALENVGEQLKAGFLTSTLSYKIRDYVRFFGDVGNHYSMKNLQVPAQRFVGELQGLERFLSQRFSEQRYGADEVRLMPNVDADIERAHQLCGRAKNRYRQYRQEVKLRLIV